MEMRSFKQKVLDSILVGAESYQTLLNLDFIVRSLHFAERHEYLLRFNEDNFLHLTGVLTRLSAKEFYRKAINKTLSLNDFDCESTIQLKGTVRCKARNIRDIGTLLDRAFAVTEKLSSGRVYCLFAASDGSCTLGFVGGRVLNPNTLLNKSKIDPNSSVTDFIIEKHRRNNDV